MSSMTTPLRRLVVVLMIAAAGAAVLAWLRDRRSAGTPLDAPAWPPLGPLDGAVPAVPPSSDQAEPVVERAAPEDPQSAAAAEAEGAAPDEGATWVAPAADGSCPEGYPIKAKTSSGIFHVPEGRSYARTKPERCYATAEAAIADGYRQAKS
jgi:hypothetical protein